MIINGISLLLACINITLALNRSRVFYEMFIGLAGVLPFRSQKTVPLVMAVIWLAGAFLFFILIRGLLACQDGRLIRHALLWGVGMSAAYVLGGRLSAAQTVFESAEVMGRDFLDTVFLTVAAASCIAPVMRYKSLRELPDEKIRPLWQVWTFYGSVIFLCWLPVFLAYYPSVFAYDAEGQLYQVIAGDYSTHHPLLHTLFMGAFFRLGGAAGSYSLGMAVHSVVQMFLMAASFGWALGYLYERRIPRWLRVLLLAFYALFPANSVLSVSTTKDVLFSALVLLYTVMLCRMVCGRGTGNREASACVILSTLLLLFRNNAVYAFLVSVPLVYAGLRKCSVTEEEKKRRAAGRYLALSAAAFVLFCVCGMGLRALTHAESGSPREMLSVPLQQMARVMVKEDAHMEPALRQEAEKYISSEWVFAAYDPHLADPVKNRAVIHDDPAGLVRTWIGMGLRYPTIYVDAFLDNSVGYWYLEDISHAQVYGIGTQSGFGYLSTDTRTMPAGCEIVPDSYLPGLRRLMEKVVSVNAYQKIPVLRIVFAPAFYWWMLCLYLAAAIYRKRYEMLLPVCFLTVYYFTLLLSPTVLIRYMYPFVATVPVMFSLLLTAPVRGEDESTQ